MPSAEISADSFAAAAVPGRAPASLGLVFDGVDKRFARLFALRRVSLEIPAGEFVLLLGPNGAGKTTLLRMAALLAAPSAGAVRHVGDFPSPLASSDVRRAIAMVAHHTMLYDELTARENLQFFGRLYQVPHLDSRVDAALSASGLADRSASLVRTFSRGMRQRLSIARALPPAPRLLLLDEPSTGLDRQGAAWLFSILRALRDSGCTILMSTHRGVEAASLAARAIWLSGGSVVRDLRGAAEVNAALSAEESS